MFAEQNHQRRHRRCLNLFQHQRHHRRLQS
jgi:hypothetical protein